MSKPQPVATNFYPPIYRVCLVRERDTSVYLDQFSDPKVAYAWAREALFSTSDREELWILALDTKNQMIGANMVSMGSLSVSIVHPREVFKPLVLCSAAACIVFHNHPSGDSGPSAEDARTTERLTRAGAILGIDVLDHIICGSDNYYSFAVAGRMGAKDYE
jgi:DNA repair protein RadC